MKNIILIVAILITAPLHAQWTTDTAVNTEVGSLPNIVINAISTTDGKTYVVYWKKLETPPYNEVWLQVLDSLGNKELGPNGVLVSNNVGQVIGPINVAPLSSAATDVEENLIIGVASFEGDCRIFKMDIQGNHLWGQDGIIVPDAGMVTLLPLTTGDFILAWRSYSLQKALMQKYNTNGAAVWTVAKPIDIGMLQTAPGQMFELSNGDCTMIFHNYSGFPNSTLYAQRYDTDGTPMWVESVRLSEKITKFDNASNGYQIGYSGAQIGDTIYWGYYGNNGSGSPRSDAYVQRINPDGTLPWGENGSDFDVEVTDDEKDISIAVSPNTGNVWAVCSYYKYFLGSAAGEYVQRFDSETGERQLTNDAKLLFNPNDGGYNTHSGNLHIINNKPFFLLKSSDDFFSAATLHAVLLNETGFFAWPGKTKPVGTFQAPKLNIFLTAPMGGQAVAVWTEDKANGIAIYAQSINDVSLTGLQETASQYGLKLYPNPATDRINIALSSPTITNVQLVAYDGKGRRLLSLSKQLQVGYNLLDIETEGLPHGIYFYHLRGENGLMNLSGKFLIQK